MVEGVQQGPVLVGTFFATRKDGATNQWRRGQSTFQGYD